MALQLHRRIHGNYSSGVGKRQPGHRFRRSYLEPNERSQDEVGQTITEGNRRKKLGCGFS